MPKLNAEQETHNGSLINAINTVYGKKTINGENARSFIVKNLEKILKQFGSEMNANENVGFLVAIGITKDPNWEQNIQKDSLKEIKKKYDFLKIKQKYLNVGPYEINTSGPFKEDLLESLNKNPHVDEDIKKSLQAVGSEFTTLIRDNMLQQGEKVRTIVELIPKINIAKSILKKEEVSPKDKADWQDLNNKKKRILCELAIDDAIDGHTPTNKLSDMIKFSINQLEGSEKQEFIKHILDTCIHKEQSNDLINELIILGKKEFKEPGLFLGSIERKFGEKLLLAAELKEIVESLKGIKLTTELFNNIVKIELTDKSNWTSEDYKDTLSKIKQKLPNIKQEIINKLKELESDLKQLTDRGTNNAELEDLKNSFASDKEKSLWNLENYITNISNLKYRATNYLDKHLEKLLEISADAVKNKNTSDMHIRIIMSDEKKTKYKAIKELKQGIAQIKEAKSKGLSVHGYIEKIRDLRNLQTNVIEKSDLSQEKTLFGKGKESKVSRMLRN